MKNRLEKEFESKIISSFKKDGWWVSKMTVTSCPGFPDLAIAKNNYFCLIELKVMVEGQKIFDLFAASQRGFYKKILQNYTGVCAIVKSEQNIILLKINDDFLEKNITVENCTAVNNIEKTIHIFNELAKHNCNEGVK